MASKGGCAGDGLPCTCPHVVYSTLPAEMYLAAKNGDLKRVRKYLVDGNDINSADGDGYTLLSSACAGGQVPIVRLLQRQLYLHRNTRDWSGNTPLMYAALMGHTNIVKELASTPHECHLDVDARNNYEETALDLAVANGHNDIEDILRKVKIPKLMAPRTSVEGRLTIKSVAALELKFECEICLEDYDLKERRPRSLSCGHSLCTSCVKKTIQKLDNSLHCPFCRTKHASVVSDATDVPVNYTVESLMEQQDQ